MTEQLKRFGTAMVIPFPSMFIPAATVGRSLLDVTPYHFPCSASRLTCHRTDYSPHSVAR